MDKKANLVELIKRTESADLEAAEQAKFELRQVNVQYGRGRETRLIPHRNTR